MSAECIAVQQTLSMTNDGEPVGAEALKQARTHCALCTECARFEATLKAMRRQRPPALDDELVDRVMRAVAGEIEAEAARQAAAAAAAEAEAVAVVGATQPVPSAGVLESDEGPQGGLNVTLPRTRRDWTMWGGWMAAAAMLLVVAGIAAVRGAYFIAMPRSESADDLQTYTSAESALDESVKNAEGAPGEAGSSPSQVETSGSYIIYEGWVYTFTGTANPPASTDTTIGVVSSALDTGGAAEQLPVFRGAQAGQLVVLSAEDTYIGFDLVSRSFQGKKYGLKSGPIMQFGVWPTLPSSIPQPESPDGSPVFERSVNDDIGVAVYRRSGQSESSGIAVAPGT